MPLFNTNPPPPEPGNSALEWANIEGGGLAQLIVASLNPFVYHFFLNGRVIPSNEIESLYVSVGEPADPGGQPESVAMLTRKTPGAADGATQNQALFPGTLDVVVGALKRRLTLTCPDANDPLDVYVRLGIRSDGSSTLVEGGLKKIQIFMTAGILQVNLAWEDGMTEDLVAARPASFSA